ncbi:MAG: cupredoxin domain-containing protein [Pseudomonadota bacterium]
MGFKTQISAAIIALMVTSAQGAYSADAKAPAKAEAAKPAVVPQVSLTNKAQQITLTNKIVDGKKTWLPAELKVKVGQPVELFLVNTLPDPHGFNLPGLAPDVVVPGNSKTKVKFTPSKKETIKYTCQLHPAHVGGSVVVE